MPIILNEQEESYKYDLLKQSLRQQTGYRMNKNHSFSNRKDTNNYRKQNFKSFQQQISQWNSNSTNNINGKKKINGFILPTMRNQRKSQNIQDLSRQLLKYQHQVDESHKFRLSFLKQMTKINFKKTSSKPNASPKKVNIQLQFPQRYKKYEGKYEENRNQNDKIQQIQNQSIQPNDSFYGKRSNKGLIPSIKKLLSSSFPKKSIYRSQSDRDSYQHTKLLLNKCQIQNNNHNKKSILYDDQIYDRFQQNQRIQRQRKVKLARIQRKLPINFLSYSHKRHADKQKSLQQKFNDQEKHLLIKKSPYMSHLPTKSYYPKIQKLHDGQYQNKRLSECILLKSKKNTEQSDITKQIN